MNATQSLSDALVEFEAECRRAGGGTLLDRWAPGSSSASVQQALARIGLEAPPDALALWAWHDGVVPPLLNTHAIGGRWIFLSARDAVRRYEEMQEHDDWPDDETPPEVWGWRLSWLPLFANGRDLHIAIDCAPPTDSAPILVVNRHAQDLVTLAYSSLAYVVRQWTGAIVDGRWSFVDGEWSNNDSPDEPDEEARALL